MAAQVPFYKIISDLKLQDFIRKTRKADLQEAIDEYNSLGNNDLMYSVSVSNEERTYMQHNGILYVRLSSTQAKYLFPKAKKDRNCKVYVVAMVKALNQDEEYFDKIIGIKEDTKNLVICIPKDTSVSLEENIAATKDNVIFPYPPEEEKEENYDLFSAF